MRAVALIHDPIRVDDHPRDVYAALRGRSSSRVSAVPIKITEKSARRRRSINSFPDGSIIKEAANHSERLARALHCRLGTKDGPERASDTSMEPGDRQGTALPSLLFPRTFLRSNDWHSPRTVPRNLHGGCSLLQGKSAHTAMRFPSHFIRSQVCKPSASPSTRSRAASPTSTAAPRRRGETAGRRLAGSAYRGSAD